MPIERLDPALDQSQAVWLFSGNLEKTAHPASSRSATRRAFSHGLLFSQEMV
jgi:hypothetical protein